MNPGQQNRIAIVRTAIGLALLGMTACAASHPKSAPPPLAAPASTPSAAAAVYHDHGIAFRYPRNWKPAQAQTAVFRVVAPAGPPADLELDVPAVPGFFAGLVNPNLVATHYADDLKKQEIPDATVTFADVSAGGGTGRRIKLSGHDKQGHVAINEAIALVHGGHVYIFSCNSDEAGYAAAKAALDAAVASVEWNS